MSIRTRQMSGIEKHHHGHEQDKLDESDMEDRFCQVIKRLSNNRLGLMIIDKIDDVLKMVEDTAKWSLPQDGNELKLERPLPWIFFLPMIVWLRVFRISLSLGCNIMGTQPITPHSLVCYLQKKRFHLEILRIRGLRAIINRDIAQTFMRRSNKKTSIVGRMRNIVSKAICSPGQHSEMLPQYLSYQPDEVINKMSSKRPRDDDLPNNLTVDEMLDRYVYLNSEEDSDYMPKLNEKHNLAMAADGYKKKKRQKNIAIQKKSSQHKSTKKSSEKITVIEDDTKMQHVKKTESKSATDSENEQMHTPKGFTNTNGNTEEKKNNGVAAVAKEAAPTATTTLNTPKTTQMHLTAPNLEENKQKSTPGHESAALLKPSISTTTTSSSTTSTSKTVPLIPSQAKVEDKRYKTITTQTAIELDWTITIKTEITHKKHYPKLENINCSVDLTPASSTEDIFYSPIGSPKDIHSIFQPVPIVKGSTGDTGEVKVPSPKEANHQESSSKDIPESSAAANTKRLLNHPGQNYYQNHNAKNRNRNRQ